MGDVVYREFANTGDASDPPHNHAIECIKALGSFKLPLNLLKTGLGQFEYRPWNSSLMGMTLPVRQNTKRCLLYSLRWAALDLIEAHLPLCIGPMLSDVVGDNFAKSHRHAFSEYLVFIVHPGEHHWSVGGKCRARNFRQSTHKSS